MKNTTNTSLLTDHDVYLFKEGNHFRLYDKLGAHIITGADGEPQGVTFAVWAPNARRVDVIGDFNGWSRDAHPMQARQDQSGIWECHIPGLAAGTHYKYAIESGGEGSVQEKADPYAFQTECPPKTASVVSALDYTWQDDEWRAAQAAVKNPLHQPMSIYEVHLGSWRRDPAEPERFLTYRELAEQLPAYVRELGFTHVEFMPLMEHPFYGSWGYQVCSFFAPSRRYGTGEDFMYLIDMLHQHGIGVILDWVPSHFAVDGHGLVSFDGTALYEHQDERRGFHPDWKSYIFNYGRNEVKAFLTSSALFWLDRYHVDGIRVDAVASMLYLDYSRNEGEWIPNPQGGREDLEAVAFLRVLNDRIHTAAPHAVTIAEESTSWPMVSRDTKVGGLGFTAKWKMGWMHDTLSYFANDPVHRKFHHDLLTFAIWYGFAENFVLPLSHDEVVHGKGSLLGKMAGDQWQSFASLRLLMGYQFTHPGKKLLFMGCEFGQQREWNHDQSLDWHLLEQERHHGLWRWVQDVSRLYREEADLYELDNDPCGFEWIDCHDSEQSVLSYLRRGESPSAGMVIVCNFTPVPRHNYRLGVPQDGVWREVLNSDAREYGGSGQGNMGAATAAPIPFGDRFDYSLSVTLPPLGILIFKADSE